MRNCISMLVAINWIYINKRHRCWHRSTWKTFTLNSTATAGMTLHLLKLSNLVKCQKNAFARWLLFLELTFLFYFVLFFVFVCFKGLKEGKWRKIVIFLKKFQWATMSTMQVLGPYDSYVHAHAYAQSIQNYFNM